LTGWIKKGYIVSTIEKFRMILKSFYKIIFLNLIEYENILIYLHRVDLFEVYIAYLEIMITNTENFLDELNEDNEEIPVDISQSKRKNIHFETPTRRVGDIYHSYNTNELDPRPPFQRGYVWDKKKASRLVESILLNVPVPP
jgi:hypothetical protein